MSDNERRPGGHSNVVWTPLVDDVINTDGREVIYAKDALLNILGETYVYLPDNIRLCISTPAPVPQAVEMPLTLLEAIVRNYIRHIVKEPYRNTPEHIAECKDALAAIQAAQQRPGAEVVEMPEGVYQTLLAAIQGREMLLEDVKWTFSEEEYNERRERMVAALAWIEQQRPGAEVGE